MFSKEADPSKFISFLEMNTATVIFMFIVVLMVDALKLSRRRPSTVWGVQKKVFRQKLQENYFNSWDGSYNFRYDTGNVQHQMFRNEKRNPDGTVVGFFGYIDPEGVLRITEYIAGLDGYRQRTVLRYPV